MLLVILVGCLCLLASGQQVDEDWIDPYDMLNYDPTTKTMKKPAEVGRFFPHTSIAEWMLLSHITSLTLSLCSLQMSRMSQQT